METDNYELESATIAGGCFWCVEAAFKIIKGVELVEPGYTGGLIPNPSYEQVSSGQSEHAEAVQITFNPKIISFKEILEIFFAIHDPTTLNRQGNDIGTQYRSAIFYHNPEQQQTAEQVIADLEKQKIWGNAIVTQLVPFETFYPAEEYHQEYFANNPYQPYCQVVVAPKVAKFRQKFAHRLIG
jgi:peptide-methionine (S)-S-oxide reductase